MQSFMHTYLDLVGSVEGHWSLGVLQLYNRQHKDSVALINSDNFIILLFIFKTIVLNTICDRACENGPITLSYIFANICGILWDFAGILQEFCTRFLQNPARSCRILQDLTTSCTDARKKDLFL